MTTRPLRVGDVLSDDPEDPDCDSGFCGGAFGRNSHEVKRVEAIGADWVVARTVRGAPVFADGDPDFLVQWAQGTKA